MGVKQAVATAKSHIADLYADENIVNIGLEEVDHDHVDDAWLITIGFSRPWESKNAISALMPYGPRSYKVVRISKDGSVLSVKNRDMAPAY